MEIEKSAGKDNNFEIKDNDVVIGTSEGYVVIDPTTWIVTAWKMSPEMTARLEKDGFDNILKEKGDTGAWDLIKKLKAEGKVSWMYMTLGAHRHIIGKDASGKPFDVDLQSQD